jgi:hypothetical protein
MYHCSIEGCKDWVSEIFSPEEVRRWFIAVPEKRPNSDDGESWSLVQVWPNLDWWAVGGVDMIVLCPIHKKSVFWEIEKQRKHDSSMDQEKPNPGNRS